MSKLTFLTLDELINEIKGKESQPELLINFLQYSLGELKKRLEVVTLVKQILRMQKRPHHVIDFLKSNTQRVMIPLG